MNHALKGALLSGLVFPGFGQLFLKRYMSGFLQVFIVLASMMGLIAKAVQHALAIVAEIQKSGTIIDLETIFNSVHQSIQSGDSLIFNLAFVFLIGVWIFSIVDAYRIGRQMDRGRYER